MLTSSCSLRESGLHDYGMERCIAFFLFSGMPFALAACIAWRVCCGFWSAFERAMSGWVMMIRHGVMWVASPRLEQYTSQHVFDEGFQW